jgi:hypothetical protein
LLKLDYTIESPQERLELVNQILAENPEPNDAYLEILGGYLVLAVEKQKRKEDRILTTENRMVTINKRELSLEGLIGQMENGEDGLYNLINQDKHQIFQPKVEITKADIEEIPGMKELREGIQYWEEKRKTVTGRDAYICKKAAIEMRKDQYLLKNSYRQPIMATKLTHSGRPIVHLPSREWIDPATGQPMCWGISLLDYKVISTVLCYYDKLRQKAEGQFEDDTWYFLEDFDKVCTTALEDYPMYRRIVEYKIDNRSNIEIQQMLEAEFGFSHSIEYISSLWRNKIPKLIAAQATDEWLEWYYTFQEKGRWKKCSRCDQIKLAHTRFFSVNKTGKDGFYSICKCCRNKKKGG